MTSSQKPPTVSLVIPSRNRGVLARIAVDFALAHAPEDSEIVFSDNSDTPVQLEAHPRLRVVRTHRILSMPENWEQGLRAATGKWVMLLSDKDRVVPGSIEQILELAADRFEVVTYVRVPFCQDIAPQLVHDREVLLSAEGTLAIQPGPTKASNASSAAALKTWYTIVDYHCRLPMLYTALIRREIIGRALARTGRFFLGMAPDVASGLQIASNCHEYVSTTLPGTLLQIPTRQPRDWSNGISALHAGDLARQFLSEFGSSPLEDLPFTSASLIMQTLLQFQRACPSALEGLALAWHDYAGRAANEIEQSDSNDPRLPRLWKLLQSTQRARIRPRAIVALALVLARTRTGFVHRPLRAALRRAIRPIQRQSPDPVQTEVVSSTFPGLLPALTELAGRRLELGRPMAVDGSSIG